MAWYGIKPLREPMLMYCQFFIVYFFSDPECRSQFEEKLVKMPTSEAIYLLTTFANMACSRPQHSVDIVEAITSEIYEVGRQNVMDTHSQQ